MTEYRNRDLEVSDYIATRVRPGSGPPESCPPRERRAAGYLQAIALAGDPTPPGRLRGMPAKKEV
jgi:hypothetical protein